MSPERRPPDQDVGGAQGAIVRPRDLFQPQRIAYPALLHPRAGYATIVTILPACSLPRPPGAGKNREADMKVARAAMPASFGLFVLAVLTAVLFAYPATANAASVVATINGGGTAIMDPTSFAQGATSFGIHATLYADGPAPGDINCIDHVGRT